MIPMTSKLLNHADRIHVRELPKEPAVPDLIRWRATLGFFVDHAIEDKRKNDNPKAEEEAIADAKTKLVHMAYGPIIERLQKLQQLADSPLMAEAVAGLIKELQAMK